MSCPNNLSEPLLGGCESSQKRTGCCGGVSKNSEPVTTVDDGRTNCCGGPSKSSEPVTTVDDESPETLVITTRLSVRGICCSSEIPLCKEILSCVPGVSTDISVSLPLKQVTVKHNRCLAPPSLLVDVLNEANLDASLMRKGNKDSDSSNSGNLLSSLPKSGLFALLVWAISLIMGFILDYLDNGSHDSDDSLQIMSQKYIFNYILPLLALPCGVNIYKRALKSLFPTGGRSMSFGGMSGLATVVTFASIFIGQQQV